MGLSECGQDNFTHSFAEIFDYRLYSLLTARFSEEFNNTKDAGGTIQFSCKIKIAKEFFFFKLFVLWFCGLFKEAE